MAVILLSKVQFQGRHGATAIERETARTFEVDVEVEADVDAAERSDRLADTIDYRAMGEIIVGIGEGESHHLLESLARRMIDRLRAGIPGARRVTLELRKFAPPSCPGHPAYAAVRLTSG